MADDIIRVCNAVIFDHCCAWFGLVVLLGLFMPSFKWTSKKGGRE